MTQPFDADSTHLSDEDRALLIEQYTGQVESQFAKAAIMRQYVNVRSVLGTDTLVNNRVGKTTLKAVVPGVRPDADPTGFGRVSVTVDTIILARDNVSLMNNLQANFPVMMELGDDHGKELGKFFDEAFIIQAIKGAGQSAPSGLNGAMGAGKSTQLAAPGDEVDPDKLEEAIEDILQQMQEEDIDTAECIIMVRPEQFRTLRNNDKLLSRDFNMNNPNGDFAAGTLVELAGSRIVMTNRIPSAVITGHKLSNADNSNAYDINATEAKTIAVILHPKSLLAGETIPLTSGMWYNREELQWFVDSYMAFGVTTNRPDVCGRVLKA